MPLAMPEGRAGSTNSLYSLYSSYTTHHQLAGLFVVSIQLGPAYMVMEITVVGHPTHLVQEISPVHIME